MLNNDCGIYLIVSPTNKRYVGSSKSLKKRFNRYKNYSCSRQCAILSSLLKYKFENHKLNVLFYCEEKELLFWERVFGDLYLASADFENGLNITLPGYDDIPQLRTKEFRQRVSDIQKKRFLNPDEREKVSQRTKLALAGKKDIIRAAQKKRYENPEQRQIRSKTRKDYYKKNPDAIVKMSQDAKKRFDTNPELKEKCVTALNKYYQENPNIRSERMKLWHKTNPKFKNQSVRLKEYYNNNPEAKLKASEKSKLQFANPENNPRSKKVVNTETGEMFSCIKLLAKHLSKKPETVTKWIKNNKIPYRYA